MKGRFPGVGKSWKASRASGAVTTLCPRDKGREGCQELGLC